MNKKETPVEIGVSTGVSFLFIVFVLDNNFSFSFLKFNYTEKLKKN